jgi:uncharacterized protein YdhG (YjbR/CyaY superfamily)
MPPKSKIKAKPKTIDEYLAALSDDKRAALERLRKIIRAAAPGAEEHISYQLPAFRLDGKWLVWIGAAANHCAIYGVGRRRRGRDQGLRHKRQGTLRFRWTIPYQRPSCGSLSRLGSQRLPLNNGRQGTSPRAAADTGEHGSASPPAPPAQASGSPGDGRAAPPVILA